MARAANNTVAGVVLASGSAIRRQLLEQAGVQCRVAPAVVDEPVLRGQLLRERPAATAAEIALVLARAKAEKVSRHYPDALVIGADQVLSLPYGETSAGQFDLIHKSASLEEARTTLMRLRGMRHDLHVGVTIAKQGEIVWSSTDQASLTMRKFSATFLDQYLARAGAALFDCVGCYQLEGLGLQLFEQIEGNYFTILGLPMLPLLAELRQRQIGVI
jgi:septum formation protein